MKNPLIRASGKKDLLLFFSPYDLGGKDMK